MIDNIFIANRIREEREALGLTQEEFGKAIGSSKQSVCAWEKARNLPDIFSIAKIANLSGKELTEFFAQKTTTPEIKSQNATGQITLTEKELQTIYKLRAVSSEKRKAFEVLLGVNEKEI